MDNKTRIDASKIQALLVASGLKLTPQKGFVRVDGTNEGNRIYVAFTKTVARIDIAGFALLTPDGQHREGYCTPHCGPFGSVHQQVDFTRPEAAILDTIRELLLALKHAPAFVKEPKAPKAAGRKANPNAAWSPDLLASRAARLDAIRKVAAEKGIAVSSQTEQELSANA